MNNVVAVACLNGEELSRAGTDGPQDVQTNMLNAGVDKVHRDPILGHSLQGMDAHYMAPSEEDLHRAMARYTEWLDSQLAEKDVDQAVDQTSTPGGPVNC